MDSSPDQLRVRNQRPAGKRTARLLELMPPAAPVPQDWPHICQEASRKQRLKSSIGMALTLYFVFAALVVASLNPLVLAFVTPVTAVGATLTLIFHGWTYSWVFVAASFAVWAVGFIRAYKGHFELFLGSRDKLEVAALEEECWFRAGAENWTRRQRTRSTLIFGLAHHWRAAFTIWPLVISHTLAGAKYMRAYLRAFQRTQSRTAATQQAAIAHYEDNRSLTSGSAFLVLLPLVLISGIVEAVIILG